MLSVLKSKHSAITLVILICSLWKIEAQVQEQQFLIDFGPNDGTNGNITSVPDFNGNYWNNYTDAAVSVMPTTLINTNNSNSGYLLEVTERMYTNGILNGGLLTSDNNLLGDLAINTATQDYFYTANKGELLFTNLNVDNAYQIEIFASRNSTNIRETKYHLIGKNDYKEVLQTSGTDIGGVGYHGNTTTVINSGLIFPDCEGKIRLEVIEEAGNYAYINLVRITEYSSVSYAINTDSRIAFMGSSVATGWNAVMDRGYAYQYTDLLKDRFLNTISTNDWDIMNISIPGNSTQKVLDRWDNHIIPQCSKYKYVVYALSLGNENIKNEGQVAFDRFRDNLEELIIKTKNEGMVPILTNTYPSMQYGDTEYNFLKEMNILIHRWDVPSINLLGGLDDGTGKWVNNYWDDDWHPNTIGHSELMYTLVPSLFDALDSGKPQPIKLTDTYIATGSSVSNSHIKFIPEHIVHSFTTSFEFKTNNTGVLSKLMTNNGYGNIAINNTGKLVYESPTNGIIEGLAIINDNQWHRVTLSHYYAQGLTFLYVNDQLQATINEQQIPLNLYLNSLDSPDNISYRNWSFYRSAMNVLEVAELEENEILKSRDRKSVV